MSKDDTAQGTHFAECWRVHHDCALAQIERLRAALNAADGELAGNAYEGYGRDEEVMAQIAIALNR